MDINPFWTEDFPHPSTLPVTSPAELPDHVDIAVIGGGYTGLHAGLAAVDAGMSVLILDAQQIGWGASSRNGGMMTTGLKEDVSVVAAKYGMETACRLWQWALASIDHVEETIRQHAIDCDFSRSGHAYLAYKPGHFAKMRSAVDWYRTHLAYEEMVAVGTDSLHTEIGSRSYYGAVIDTRAGALHPAKYVYGLARAAAASGVRLVEAAPVKEVAREGDGFRLTVGNHSLTADKVLLASNGYTGDLVPAVRRGVFPVGSYIITTEPLPPDLQADVSPRGRMFFDSKNFLNYFRLTPDGRMLFGGRHNLSPTLDIAESARMMHLRMLEVFPQLAEIPLSHSWSGRLGLTFDLLPHAGRLASGPHAGLYYAYGYAGHGVAVASYLGYQIGRVMAGVSSDTGVTGLKEQRYVFTRYDRLYLPVVSTWFRFLDRVS